MDLESGIGSTVAVVVTGLLIRFIGRSIRAIIMIILIMGGLLALGLYMHNGGTFDFLPDNLPTLPKSGG